MTSKIESNNYRILVCGSSSVGKTSLINLLTGNLSKTKKNSQEIIYNDKKFTFIEAKGFELNDKGIIFNTTAEKNLKDSLSRINDGFNLVIHVIKKGSILETDKLNYDMIVRDLFREKINVLCVTTFLDEEEGENLKKYWKNLEISLKQRGFNYTYGVGVCCAKSINKVLEEIYQSQRAISYDLLWDAILRVTHQTNKRKPKYSFLKGGYEEFNICSSWYGMASDHVGIDNPVLQKTDNEVKLKLFIMHSNDELYKKFNALFEIDNFLKNLQIFSLSIKNSNDKEVFYKFFKKITLNEQSKYAFFILDEIENKQKRGLKLDKILSIFKEYFSIEIDSVCLICEENYFVENDASNQLLSLKREQFKSKNFEKIFLKICEHNPEIENIFNEYRAESKNRIRNLLIEVFKNSRKISIPDNLENIYRFADWPNKVNFDLDLEIFECALACDSTKNNPESRDILIRKEWLELEDSEKLDIKKYGYVGKCWSYERNDYDELILLFAHRGTQFNKMGNILADLDIASQIKPKILQEALKYEKLILDKIQESKKIVHTGFSLGGYIAAECATVKTGNFKKYAVAFDSPGIEFESSLKNYSEFEDYIESYFLVPNIVNTCHKHVGKMFEIESGINVEKESTSINTESKLISEIEHAYNSHDLDLIIRLTRKYVSIRCVKEWPIAKNNTEFDSLAHSSDNKIIYY